MDKIKETIERIKYDKKTLKRIYLISFVSALLLLVMIVKSTQMTGKYITDKNGNVVGISRGSLSKVEEYDVNLEMSNNEGSSKRELTITKNPVKEKSAQTKEDEEALERSAREAEINGIISDIELSGDKRIYFPTELSDGTKLRWERRNDTNSDIVVIPIIYLLLLVVVVKSGLDVEKDKNKERKQSIIRSLPRFTNQLLLMMNAGMILSDAFERISDSYRLIPDEERAYFENEVIKLCDSNSDHRLSTATLISDFAGENNVKELMRISTILTENEKRGCDVIDNLSREAIYLWNDRKIVAIEKGKMIDTKMAYPLGMLLILLIVITMAPALLTM